MAKFRVVRGGVDGSGMKWSLATTVEAETARDAVKKSTDEEMKSAKQTFGGLIAPSRVAPVVAVYELVLLDEATWK